MVPSAMKIRALEVQGLPINVIAFLFSAAVGMLFGDAPARRAVRLNPTDALRHASLASGRAAQVT
jgi:putative ABC transport system permease protein